MTKIILSFVVLITGISLTAQHDHLHPCGTSPVKSDWLKKYQLHPESFATTRDDLLYVPLAVTIVAEDNGGKAFSDIGLQNALCVLNKDFLESDIQFYLGMNVRHIRDSRYAIHETVLQGAAMMFEYNIPNMINCYFMDDAASNCGYNLPYAGMCVSNNCGGIEDHTWAHEMGHQLSLPHPFLGWEGGVSFDGSVQHDFNDPAPETVLYDYTYFKDTLILDTMIVDTAFVEKMDGSNCNIAADGFCDTAPDYLASRWACFADSTSMTEQTDPNGVKFFSDGTLIMSYALDNCSARFSNDQIAAMRANLMDDKPELLGNEDVQPAVTETTLNAIYPSNLERVFPENIELGWAEVENATKYLVQLSIFEGFNVPVFDTIITTNNVVISDLQFPTRDHWFRVKAFTDYDFCIDWLEGIGSFEPDESVDTKEEEHRDWKVFPTLISGHSNLYIETPDATGKINVSIFNSNGQTVVNRFIHGHSVDIGDLSSGIYIVQVRDNVHSMTRKIVIE